MTYKRRCMSLVLICPVVVGAVRGFGLAPWFVTFVFIFATACGAISTIETNADAGPLRIRGSGVAAVLTQAESDLCAARFAIAVSEAIVRLTHKPG